MFRTKEAQLGFRLKEDKAKKFKALCALKGHSIQFVLERAVDEFITKVENEKSE